MKTASRKIMEGALFDELLPKLKVLNFTKKAKPWFTYSTQKGFCGTLAISTSRSHIAEGFSLFPHVGVRCDAIEDLHCSLMSGSGVKYTPSITTPLNSLCGSTDLRYIGGDSASNDLVIQGLVDDLRKYAIPFYHESSSLPLISEKLKTMKYSNPCNCEFRYYISLFLLGKGAMARDLLENRIKEIEIRDEKTVYSKAVYEFSIGFEELLQSNGVLRKNSSRGGSGDEGAVEEK